MRIWLPSTGRQFPTRFPFLSLSLRKTVCNRVNNAYKTYKIIIINDHILRTQFKNGLFTDNYHWYSGLAHNMRWPNAHQIILRFIVLLEKARFGRWEVNEISINSRQPHSDSSTRSLFTCFSQRDTNNYSCSLLCTCLNQWYTNNYSCSLLYLYMFQLETPITAAVVYNFMFQPEIDQ